MTSLILFGAAEGGLFDFDATLPLMAVQEREGYISTSRAEAKSKLAEVEKLEADLKDQLKQARKTSQKVISDAEQESDKLYREALSLATAEANASRDKARQEIESERDSALSQLKSDADKLGDLIVERLLAAK